MNNKKNFISALILQIITMISGLILPRFIISTLGSEINGLCSSITQFLSFITLLEGGLGAVILAELYRPIENDDIQSICSILYSCHRFFRKLAMVFLVYTVVLSLVYPVYWAGDFDFFFTMSLIWILSITTIVQYLFSITNKLLLQACQKIYIVNCVTAITIILNLILSICVIYIYPEIHIIKIVAALVFLIQPILYQRFVDKKYSFRNVKFKKDKKYVIKNRWSGFAQNLAYFVNMNTDVAVLTIFMSLSDVSVYTIYMLPVVALRAIIISLTNSYQSALGKYYAEGNQKELKRKFNQFEKAFWLLGMILFSVCLLMINAFVTLYTKGVDDANYWQPIFALIIVIANMVYCIREPYRLLVLAAGKFKETNFGSMFEAVMNLLISIMLVNQFGLLGVAIGTLVAIIYRLVYFIIFLKRNILYIKYKKYMHLIFTLLIVLCINIFLYFNYPLMITSYFIFIIYGVIITISETILILVIYKMMYRVCNTLFGKRGAV